MRSRSLRALVALLVLVGIHLVAAPTATAGPYCGITWGSQPRSAAGTTVGMLTGVRTGRHECYDRLVVDVDSPVTHWDVLYVDGLGGLVPGGAQLDVRVGTAFPANHTWLIHQVLADVRSYPTFRAVRAGGGDGVTSSVWLGVRARLPFRAFVLAGPGAGSRLVVDVAHRWCAPGTTC